MTKDMAVVAELDPRVAVFAIGAACIVVLAGLALGYDVSIDVQESSMRLSKPCDAVPALCEA